MAEENSGIAAKRVYAQPEEADGFRVLVDRLWPRGISKEKASLGLWCRDIAPSAELRKWFHHDPEKYAEFCSRYLAELEQNPAAAAFRKMMLEKAAAGRVTLLYAAKDEKNNNAAVLRKWLTGEES